MRGIFRYFTILSLLAWPTLSSAACEMAEQLTPDIEPVVSFKEVGSRAAYYAYVIDRDAAKALPPQSAARLEAWEKAAYDYSVCIESGRRSYLADVPSIDSYRNDLIAADRAEEWETLGRLMRRNPLRNNKYANRCPDFRGDADAYASSKFIRCTNEYLSWLRDLRNEYVQGELALRKQFYATLTKKREYGKADVGMTAAQRAQLPALCVEIGEAVRNFPLHLWQQKGLWRLPDPEERIDRIFKIDTDMKQAELRKQYDPALVDFMMKGFVSSSAKRFLTVARRVKSEFQDLPYEAVKKEFDAYEKFGTDMCLDVEESFNDYLRSK